MNWVGTLSMDKSCLIVGQFLASLPDAFVAAKQVLFLKVHSDPILAAMVTLSFMSSSEL